MDTTPSLVRRPETIGLPVFAGRTLTLQRRVDGDTWETLGTSTVLADGMGYFPGVTAAAGTVVYRVRQEDVMSGANRIGWMQTFPTYVTVLDPGQAPRSLGARAPTGRRDARAPPRRRRPHAAGPAPRAPRRAAATAGTRRCGTTRGRPASR